MPFVRSAYFFSLPDSIQFGEKDLDIHPIEIYYLFINRIVEKLNNTIKY